MQVSVLVNNSTNITIQDMSIGDNGYAPGHGGPDALVFWNASTGTLSNDVISASYTINGEQSGQAIAVDGSSGTTSLTVSGSSISGFQKNGIDVIDGNGSSSGASDTTSLTVTSTTITGAGSTSTIAQNGIVLWDRGGGSVSGTVSDSTISGFQYTPLDIPNGDNGTGILTYGTSASVTVSNSNLTDSDLDAANATVSGTFNAAGNYWGSSAPNFNSIIGQASDGYSSVTYTPYYLHSGPADSSSADSLTSLSLPSGTLSPTFSSAITSYTASVPNSVTSEAIGTTASSGTNVGGSGTHSLSVGTNTITLTVTSADGSASKTYTLKITRATASQTVVDSSGNATVTGSKPTVVVTNDSTPLNITVSSGTTTAKIDFSSLKSGSSATVPQTTINTQNASVVIPASTKITSSGGTWDGTITAPTIQGNSTVSLPTQSGTVNTVGTVIEVGAGDVNLTFSKAVKLTIPNQAGTLVAFERNGKYTQITTVCSANTQAAGDSLPAGGDCYVNVGNDMVVWTKHFTKFITYSVSNKYVVKSGDTFSGIAAQTGLTLAKLEALNPSAGHPAGNFSLILPGDVLKLGGAVEPAVATNSTNTSVTASAKVLGTKTTTPSHTAISAASTTTPSVAAAVAKNSGLKWYEWTAIAIAALGAVGSVAYIYRNAGRR